MITSHCMLQSRLKVVIQCKYGESSRPSSSFIVLLTTKRTCASNSNWIQRLSLAISFCCYFRDSDYSHCFKVYPEHSIIESWLLRLLAENGCFTGEGVVPALHVDMDTRIRTRPCQIKQTSLWHLQGQHPGRVFFNSRNLRNKTISWFVVRGRNGQVWRLRWPLLLLVRRLEQKGYRIGFITRMVRRLLWQQLTFLAAWLFKKIIS